MKPRSLVRTGVTFSEGEPSRYLEIKVECYASQIHDKTEKQLDFVLSPLIQVFDDGVSLHAPNEHTHRHAQWPRDWHVGHSNVGNKFQDTPRCSPSAVPTACRPTSGRHLCPIRATRGPWSRTYEEKKHSLCSPQSHRALFNY